MLFGEDLDQNVDDSGKKDLDGKFTWARAEKVCYSNPLSYFVTLFYIFIYMMSKSCGRGLAFQGAGQRGK